MCTHRSIPRIFAPAIRRWPGECLRHVTFRDRWRCHSSADAPHQLYQAAYRGWREYLGREAVCILNRRTCLRLGAALRASKNVLGACSSLRNCACAKRWWLCRGTCGGICPPVGWCAGLPPLSAMSQQLQDYGGAAQQQNPQVQVKIGGILCSGERSAGLTGCVVGRLTRGKAGAVVNRSNSAKTSLPLQATLKAHLHSRTQLCISNSNMQSQKVPAFTGGIL